MERLVFKDGSGDLTIREFATMRDGSIMIRVTNKMGDNIWVDAAGLEVQIYD